MISSMQAAITSQLSEIVGNMAQLEERVVSLEGSFEELPRHQSPMTTPTSSAREERKRRTPLEIQVFMLTLTYHLDY